MKESMRMKLGRVQLTIDKRRPEIYMGLALAGFVGTVYTTWKASKKMDKVVADHETRIRLAKMNAVARSEMYVDKEDVDTFADQKEVAIAWLKTIKDGALVIAPVTALFASTIHFSFKAMDTLNGRYIGALEYADGLTTAFNAYRSRVQADQGKEKDLDYLYGRKREKETVLTKDEQGNDVAKEVDVENYSEPIAASQFAKYFDESNPNWDSSAYFNLQFLRAQQEYATQKLRTVGHLFLNEVYSCLGFEDTPGGALYGWILGEGEDNTVSFGMFVDSPSMDVRRFVNGDANTILLDFNVSPKPIWDRI